MNTKIIINQLKLEMISLGIDPDFWVFDEILGDISDPVTVVFCHGNKTMQFCNCQIDNDNNSKILQNDSPIFV